MVGAELGRPVAVDAHPKHAIALGAALFAGMEEGMTGAAGPVQADAGNDIVPGAAAAGAGVGAAAVVGAAAAAANAPVETAASVDTGRPEAPAEPSPHPAAPSPPAATVAPPAAAPPAAAPPPPAAPPPRQPTPAPAAPPPPSRPYAETVRTTPAAPKKKRKQPVGAILAALVVIAALAGGLAFVLTQGGDEEDPDQVSASDTSNGGEEGTGGPVETVPCPTSEQAFVCLTDVAVQNDRFVVEFDPVGFTPDPSFAPGTLHFHVFLDPPTPPENAGASTQCPGCVWHASGGTSPLVVDPDGANGVTPGDVSDPASTSICVLMAEGETHNSFGGTGNCLSLEGVL
jgi:outer membrane biosynthesis protein TonB